MSFLNDNNKEKLDSFVKFVKEQLEIKTVPTIKIQNNRDGLKTTANYDYTKLSEKQIQLLTLPIYLSLFVLLHEENSEINLKNIVTGSNTPTNTLYP